MFKWVSIARLGLIAALFILVILSASPVLADPALLDPTPITVKENALSAKYAELLQEGRYAELDKDVNQLQQDFERGKWNDVNLMHIFSAFYDTDLGLEEKYNAWIAAFPKSYAALEARATYYRRLAYHARGGDYISQTTEHQISSMESFLKKAVTDAHLAADRTAKPVLSYFGIFSAAMLVGDQKTKEEILNKTIKIDPKNFSVRYKYMISLETKWGGSLEKMQEFRKEVRNAGLSKKQLSYLDELVSDEANWLGIRYLAGTDVKQDYKLAMELFQKGALMGNVRSEINIGLMYGNGWGVQKDIAEAMRWYKKAEFRGYWGAQNYIGRLYKNALTPVNYDEALRRFRLGAAHDDTASQISLGLMYQEGNGVKQDYVEAMKWYKKAEFNGDFAAESYIAELYQHGKPGIPADPAEAIRRFRRGAEHGNAAAQYHLGSCYEWGKGVRPDNSQALIWYQKAADQGDTNAQIGLGRLYSSKAAMNNSPQEMDVAIMWYQKAADQGDPNGAKLVEQARRDKATVQKNLEYMQHRAKPGFVKSTTDAISSFFGGSIP
ncbi:MAG: DUF4034 domain-containing protein [Alphaproteobacteria bacterium]|nr:MAG: DUF4034 domain-containing protein [Alphaproteobacteria bacterium]